MAKATKPKPPTYPRPVSEICADELPLSKTNIALDVTFSYQKHGQAEDDPDLEAEKRAAKKRRIEACAQAYLRNEPLYIMSAQLKGPFGPGWKNPWAKKRVQRVSRGKGKQKGPEIPETARKDVIEEAPAEDKRNTILEARKRYLALKSVSQEDREAKPRPSVVPASSPLIMDVTASVKAARNVTPKKKIVGKEKRIEEWLRTNETFFGHDQEELETSPTPMGMHKQNLVAASEEKKSEHLATESRFTNPSREPEVQSKLKSLPTNGGLATDVARQVQQLTGELHGLPDPSITLPEAQTTRDTEIRVANNVVDQPSISGPTINQAKRRSLHVVPPAANLSPFEYRKVVKDSHVIDVHDEGTNSKSDKIAEKAQAKRHSFQVESSAEHAQLPEGHVVEHESHKNDVEVITSTPLQSPAIPEASPVRHEINQANPSDDVAPSSVGPEAERPGAHANPKLVPGLSEATSDMNTADLLPSAQQLPTFQHTASSGLQDISFLEPKSLIAVAVSFSDANELDQPPVNMSLVSSDRVSHAAGLEWDPTPIAMRSTQEMLADITPFNFSTVKKADISELRLDTPGTATKPRTSRKAKQASFGQDRPSSVSPHSSIQNMMKAKVGKSHGSPPSTLAGKKGASTAALDKNAHNSSQRLSASFPGAERNNSSQLRSILKSSNKAAVSGSVGRSKSTSSVIRKREDYEQTTLAMGSGQNACLNDDTFDLDGVIGELGSFLGTWDVDKEASSLVAS